MLLSCAFKSKGKSVKSASFELRCLRSMGTIRYSSDAKINLYSCSLHLWFSCSHCLLWFENIATLSSRPSTLTSFRSVGNCWRFELRESFMEKGDQTGAQQLFPSESVDCRSRASRSTNAWSSGVFLRIEWRTAVAFLRNLTELAFLITHNLGLH